VLGSTAKLASGNVLDAVFISRAFTVSGESPGSRCKRIAAAPLTTGAAMLVPLSCMYAGARSNRVSCSRRIDDVSRIRFSPASNPAPAASQSDFPAPTMSGFTSKSIHSGPSNCSWRFQSSARSGVSFGFIEPTVIA
jgi:hypothetical protein